MRPKFRNCNLYFILILASDGGTALKPATVCIPVNPKAALFNQRAISWKEKKVKMHFFLSYRVFNLALIYFRYLQWHFIWIIFKALDIYLQVEYNGLYWPCLISNAAKLSGKNLRVENQHVHIVFKYSKLCVAFFVNIKTMFT